MEESERMADITSNEVDEDEEQKNTEDQGEPDDESSSVGDRIQEESKVFECIICAQIFADNGDLEEHQKIHENAVLHECPICALICNGDDEFAKHLGMHSDADPCENEAGESGDNNEPTEQNSNDPKEYPESYNNNCIICGKVFRLRTEFLVHMKLHSDTKLFKENKDISTELNIELRSKVPLIHHRSQSRKSILLSDQKFVCVVCLQQFSSKVDLLKHYVVHNDLKVFTCVLCQKDFADKNELFTHGKVHNNSADYSCGICLEVFRTKDGLIKHMDDHISGPHACNICGVQFDQFLGLTQHMALVHSSKDECAFKCKLCGQEFNDNNDYNQHVKYHTHPFQCPICPRICDNKIELENHVKDHSGKRHHKCPTCNKEFLHRSNLNRHVKTHSEEKQHKCLVCGRGFHNVTDLNVHARIHTGEKPYQCSNCGKRFRTCSNLNTHLVVHNNEKLFKCAICDKDFNFNSDLKRHMRTHTEEKPYQCTICEKLFSQSCNLETHMRSHRGEKPYDCQECGKAFGHQCDLKRHMTTHTQSRAFECEVCKKTFNRQSNLRTHLRTHGKDKRFECEVCLKRFAQQAHLKAHMITHSSERPYKCLRCGASFSRNSSLNKHMRVHNRTPKKEWDSANKIEIKLEEAQTSDLYETSINPEQFDTSLNAEQFGNVTANLTEDFVPITEVSEGFAVAFSGSGCSSRLDGLKALTEDNMEQLNSLMEGSGRFGTSTENDKEPFKIEGVAEVSGDFNIEHFGNSSTTSKEKAEMFAAAAKVMRERMNSKGGRGDNSKRQFGNTAVLALEKGYEAVAGFEKDFRCFVCDEHLTTKDDIVNHVKTHGDEIMHGEETHGVRNPESQDFTEVVVKKENSRDVVY